MASTFKSLTANDIASTKTLLAESIPISGSLLSGTYGTWPNETNVKNYSHGLFQSQYDYSFLSSSANKIMDMTLGFSSDSALSRSAPPIVAQQDKKINIYNQMAQVLMGHDQTGSIQPFDSDGNILAGGTKIKEAVFLCFSRLLVKDEIKKGSFSIKIGTGSYPNPNTQRLTIDDNGAQSSFKVNSPAGEYGILSCSSGQAVGSTNGNAGLIFYQAGVVVLTASIFGGIDTNTVALSDVPVSMSVTPAGAYGGLSLTGSLTGSEISSSCDYIRRRLYDISFVNTTEINSTIYYCRIGHNEFNYSSNPTYVSQSKIRVKNTSLDEPVSYITTVGLYSPDNALLAVAKISEPIKKTPSADLTLRIRQDF